MSLFSTLRFIAHHPLSSQRRLAAYGRFVAAAERVTGARVPVVVGPRRAGDPPSLVASADAARTRLGWSPQYVDLDPIVHTAWEWLQKRAVVAPPTRASASS